MQTRQWAETHSEIVSEFEQKKTTPIHIAGVGFEGKDREET